MPLSAHCRLEVPLSPGSFGTHLLGPRGKLGHSLGLGLCSPLIPAPKFTLGTLFQRFNSICVSKYLILGNAGMQKVISEWGRG